MEQAKWYILHTFSGYENKVADNIIKVVENSNLHHLIEEVLVPTEEVTENIDGKIKTYKSKIYPGYVYVKMIMTDESWYICRNTRGCTGFVGPGSKPVQLTDEEVANLGVVTKVEETFAVGDLVTIVHGNLEGMEGKITDIDAENQTAVVTISMFGRETPTTLELSAIKKIN